MPLMKLTCPKCRAVLRPAKPVDEGKTIKCPKCEVLFKAGETPADAAAKKPAAAAPAKPAEDEEEEAIYTVARDEEMEKKVEEKERKKRLRMMRERERLKQGKKKKKVDDDEDEYADADEDDLAAQILRNLKVKDPRGKAQEMVVTPSNWLLRTGLIGFFSWVLVFIFFLIPIVFPNLPDNSNEDEKRIAEREKAEEAKARAKGEARATAEYDFFKDIRDEKNRMWAVPLFLTVLVLGMVHGGLIALGAVRLQGLESYRWAVTSCVLALIPLYMAPLWLALWWLFDKLDAENPWAVGCFVFAWGPLCGGLCLMKVLNEKVKRGFAFKPD